MSTGDVTAKGEQPAVHRKYLTPTTIARAANCLHSWFLETHADAGLKVEPDAGMQLMFASGLDHEQAMVETLGEIKQPDWDGTDFVAGNAATLQLLAEGAEWIYQAPLAREDAVGVPDLLRRVEGNSALGSFSYIAVDIKGHKKVSKKDRHQLHAYSYLLEPILGHRPALGQIWLNTGELVDVDLAKRSHEFTGLKSQLEGVMSGDISTVGVRCGECAQCPWRVHCRTQWEEHESATLIYGATGSKAKKLIDGGFASWRDIADASGEDIAAKTGMTLKDAIRLGRRAAAWKTDSPQLLEPVSFPVDRPLIFYDIETCGDLVYCHGLVRVDRKGREEKQFAGRVPEQEGELWRAFLDYLARDSEAVVYCWATYEFEFVRQLWAKYGGNADGYKHLELMRDQCDFVKTHFALPTSSYSIKDVAPVFGFRWDAADAGGLNSEAWYREWLDNGDQSLYEKILRYNLDDVIAMEVIDKALRDKFA